MSALFACVLAASACTSPVVDDAGASDDAGVDTRPDGFTACGDDTCQPGTRCDTGACRPGCQFDVHCLSSERCDGSVCRTASARACVDDDDGAVPCGETGCAASTWCRDPALGVCLDGCRSSANCPCGQVCTTTATAGSGVCTDASGTPVCGDDVCQPGESELVCPADCVSWTAECQEGCAQYLFRECPSFDDAACVNACVAADETVQRDFVACAANGAAVCSPACLSILGL